MLNLQKGQKLNLSKQLGLAAVTVGLGWKPKKFDSQADFDLDASVFVLQEDGSPFGKILIDPPHHNGWLAYYGQQNLPGIEHLGDCRTGGSSADGDDETINIDFTKLPMHASRVAVVVTIHEGAERKQTFGQVNDAYINIYNEVGAKQAEFDLDDNASTSVSMMFVEFTKNSAGEWVMQAIGEGFNQSLADFLSVYKAPGF